MNGQKYYGKKELFGEVEASLSACTMKSVEEKNDEGEGVGGGMVLRRVEAEEEDNSKK